jgi:hypothetical protein
MYSQPIDRNHPGCILFLVDQSGSMQDTFGGGQKTKAEMLAASVNRLIYNLVLQCQRAEEVRDYYHLGIIGYGSSVASAFDGDLKGQYLVPTSTIADFPLRMVEDTMPGQPDVSIQQPVWIDPRAHGGTPMRQAIDTAGALVVDWANRHLDSFPPIVINISDGESTDGDPRTMAAQLRDVRTTDGNLLLFNVNVSSANDAPIEYPNSPNALPNAYAVGLFEMSSELTPYMLAVARGMALPVEPGARGFIFNADPAKVSEFLDVGTRMSLVADR